MTTRGSSGSLVIAFAGLGGTAAVVPASIPAMAAELGSSATALLPAVSAVFCGVLAGVLLAPALAVRIPLAQVVRIGAAVQLLGLVVVALTPSAVGFVVGSALAGLGFGLVEASGTALTRAHGADAAPRLLTRLTLVVAVVATLTPVIVLGASLAGGVRLVPLLVALLQLATIITVPVSSTRRNWDSRPERSGEGGVPGLPRRAFARLALLAVAVFCYVGVETILAGWSATTLQHELGASAAIAALGTSAFWLIISLGRLAGTATGRALPPATATLVCASALAVSLIAAAALPGLAPLATLALLGCAVFFAGPAYALLIGVAVGLLPDSRAVRASSFFVAIGSAGGAAVPAVASVCVVLLGPRSSTTIAASAAVVMAVVLVFSRLRFGSQRPVPVQHAGGPL
jgi:hypothetical protein